MDQFDIKLLMNDNDGKYNITLGGETIYSVIQSSGIDNANEVFDAIQLAMSITLKAITLASGSISVTKS